MSNPLFSEQYNESLRQGGEVVDLDAFRKNKTEHASRGPEYQRSSLKSIIDREQRIGRSPEQHAMVFKRQAMEQMSRTIAELRADATQPHILQPDEQASGANQATQGPWAQPENEGFEVAA